MAKSTIGTTTVKTADIKVKYDVRVSIDQDHVLRLAELYDAGEPLPNIVLTEDLTVVDGRHRLEALKFLNKTEAECDIIKNEGGPGYMLALALSYNLKSGLPPTKKDLTMVIEQLVLEKCGLNAIKALIQLPASVVRNYYNAAHSNISKRNMMKALEAVASGSTVSQAAATFKVDGDKIKAAINPKKRRARISDLKGTMQTRHRSMSATTSSTIRKMVHDWEDGEAPASQVREAIEFSVAGAKRYLRTVEEWQERFENMVKKS